MQAIIDFFQKFVDIFITRGMYQMVLDGLKNTAIITLGALAIGVVIGTLIAVIKYFAEDSKALRPLALLCDIYTTVVRGIPMVVLLMIFYFIILVHAEGIVVGIVAFGINSGAYMAELIRSGINAVNVGQMEAGRSLGLSDVTRALFLIRNNTFQSVVTLTLLAAIYLVIAIILTRLLKLLERRLSTNDKRRKS